MAYFLCRASNRQNTVHFYATGISIFSIIKLPEDSKLYSSEPACCFKQNSEALHLEQRKYFLKKKKDNRKTNNQKPYFKLILHKYAFTALVSKAYDCKVLPPKTTDRKIRDSYEQNEIFPELIIEQTLDMGEFPLLLQ